MDKLIYINISRHFCIQNNFSLSFVNVFNKKYVQFGLKAKRSDLGLNRITHILLRV